jgi:hypothetical protein
MLTVVAKYSRARQVSTPTYCGTLILVAPEKNRHRRPFSFSHQSERKTRQIISCWINHRRPLAYQRGVATCTGVSAQPMWVGRISRGGDVIRQQPRGFAAPKCLVTCYLHSKRVFDPTSLENTVNDVLPSAPGRL